MNELLKRNVGVLAGPCSIEGGAELFNSGIGQSSLIRRARIAQLIFTDKQSEVDYLS